MIAPATLTDPPWNELDEFRAATRDARVRRKGSIILMSCGRRSRSDIARTLGCRTATVDNIRAAFRDQGLAGLTPARPAGRVSRVTPEYFAATRQAVTTPPLDVGDGFRIWSINRLRQRLNQQIGIELSGDQFRRFLHRERFTFQRLEHTMEGKRDEAEHDRAKLELGELIKALSGKSEEVFLFQNEVEICRHPTLTKIWARLGEQPEIPAPGRNEKKVIGALLANAVRPGPGLDRAVMGSLDTDSAGQYVVHDEGRSGARDGQRSSPIDRELRANKVHVRS